MTKNLNSSFGRSLTSATRWPTMLHVFLRGLVVVEAERLDDFLVVLLGGLLFTFHGTHDDVLATRRRVAAAARDKYAGGRDQKWE